MAAVLQRYCSQRSNMTAEQNVNARQRELRLFVDWLGERHPGLDTFADVTRRDVEAYLEQLRVASRPKHGRPLGIASRRQIISYLRQFFADTTEWDYDTSQGGN
jgi:site-specific recombinase XerD